VAFRSEECAQLLVSAAAVEAQMTGKPRAIRRSTQASRSRSTTWRDDGLTSGATGDSVDQLAKLGELKRNGDLTQEEFDQAKARLLA
jgi:hypothetical protein